MTPKELQVGEIVQIAPHADPYFGGCLMIVSDPKSWGAQGYVEVPDGRGRAFFRCTWENMEPTGGMAVWVKE